MSRSRSQELEDEQIKRILQVELNRLYGIYLRQNRERPEQIAQTLERLHNDLKGIYRYAFAESLRPLLFVDERDSARGFFHTVCVNGLPNVLLKIVLDPRVYCWEEDAPYYHPGLEQYINSIYNSFYGCCRHMAGVPDEIFEAYYKETCRHILNKTYKLWPFLWQNRHQLFDPMKNQRSIRPADDSRDHLRRGVVLLLCQIIPIHFRLHHFHVPPLSHGMADILLYCWQYHRQLWLSQLGAQSIVLLLAKSPIAECRATISKVITDEATASRICKHMCRDLEYRKILDDALQQYLMLLNILLRDSPAFVRARVGRVDFFRAIAVACQRQLCSGDKCDEYNTPILQEGFRAIDALIGGYGPSPDMEDGDVVLLCNPATAGIIMHIASTSIIPAAEADDRKLIAYIGSILYLYGSTVSPAEMSSPPLQSEIALRDTFHRYWFRTMQKFQALNIRRSDHRYPVFEYWMGVGIDIDDRDNPPKEDAGISEGMKRCNWYECLCHENKAYHRLRVCKGCWRVLYCNSDCQRKDWSMGSHRAICVNGNEPPDLGETRCRT